MRCRRDLAAQGAITHDIANQEALGSNPIAHNYVRLYFRPKTHFHLRTEGIKLLTDNYRLPAHMSVPVMFVFDFASVVTRPNVQFCDRKLAHAGIQPAGDEAYFDGIDFTKVYHDSGISDPVTRAEINDRRMAEVLVPDSLPLAQTLKVVLCRTNFDAITLKHLLRDHDPVWLEKIRVVSKPAEVFFCWGAYVTDLQISGDALTLSVKASNDHTPNKQLKFNIEQRLPERRLVWRHSSPIDRVLVIKPWSTDVGEWFIEIEDALAFSGQVPVAAPATVVTSAAR